TDAGRLGPAEGLAQVAHILTVDETHASLDGGRHTMCAPEILTPDVAAEAVLNVIGFGDGVGLVIEGNEARHRPKNFLLRDAHAIVAARDPGGRDEVAGARGRGQLGCVCGTVEPPAKERGSFLWTRHDVTVDFGQVILADHRTDERRLIERIADTDV